jgi:SAM-dependent MidA family methyltransferase
VLGSPEQIEIVELGPGRGLFPQDVLDWSEKRFPDFFGAMHYRLVERSAALREKLARTLAGRLASGKTSVTSTLEERPPAANVILFANEFFDALPVEVIGSEGELHVACQNGHFVESFAPAPADALEYLDRYGVHPERDERVEAPIAAQEWMSRIARAVHRGFIIIIDYGYLREELLAGRHRGTIMCYRYHTATSSPYEAPGEQDITAHVNFTALEAAGRAAGLDRLALLTQAQFLMGIGEATQFADAFEECRLPQEHAKVSLQLKHLVTPAGMGESFHVLLMSRGVERERAARLAGMRFAS